MLSKNVFKTVDSPSPFIDIPAQIISIQTPRLIVRNYKVSDFNNFSLLYSDPVLMKYFDFGCAMSIEEIKTLVHTRANGLNLEGLPFGLFSILLKNQASFIGHCDLLPTKTPGVLEIGFVIKSEYQQKGYCTECVNALVHNFVPELIARKFIHLGKPISRVIATVHPNNIASLKVLKKINMSYFKSSLRFLQPRAWYKHDF